MLNITNIENTLYAWVSEVTELATIFAHPNAPRPTTPYALINIIQSEPKGIAGHKETLLLDDSIDVEYSTLEEIFVSINTYYSGAYQLATKIKDSLGRITIQEQLLAGGLGYMSAGSVQDIPEEINKKFEERGQFDCSFLTRSLDTENIETIQKIEVTNEIEDTTTVIEKP